MKIRLRLKTPDLGEYLSEPMEVDDDKYKKLIEYSKKYYLSGYEMPLENGFLVVPPDVLKRSILIIEKCNNNE